MFATNFFFGNNCQMTILKLQKLVKQPIVFLLMKEKCHYNLDNPNNNLKEE